MKKIIILLWLFLGLLMGLDGVILAQTPVCGSQGWLDAMIINNNISIQLLNTSSRPVSSVNPSTNYILRVRATGGTCLVSGYGCAAGAAPVAFRVEFASGCTIDGKTIPPDVASKDVGTANNYTANFNLTTLPSGSFGGQILVLLKLRGNEAGVCGLTLSSIYKDFNSLDDL